MIESSSFTLDNGLRVVHHIDDSTAKVAVNLLYNVGSRDESPNLTGLAHLFEHLMFAGSKNVADFDCELELAGAKNNAWTSSDYTNFYTIIPAANVETAFRAESDRMLALNINERSREIQQQVVVEEFKQTVLNQPYGDVGALIRNLLYTDHPYRWQTIGLTPDHVMAATTDDIRNFFFSHYAPNNAVLAVTGSITLARTKELAQKWFGSIPRRHIAPRTYLPEQDITQPRILRTSGDVPMPLVMLLYPMPGYNHPLYPAADIITDILANGKSTRFHKELIMRGDLFVEADASVAGTEEPGYLVLEGLLSENSNSAINTAISQLTEQAQRLTAEPPTDEELERALNKFESTFIDSTSSYIKKAEQLAISKMRGENINDIIPRYRALTPEIIKQAANQIFNPDHICTLIYTPEASD